MKKRKRENKRKNEGKVNEHRKMGGKDKEERQKKMKR